MTRIEKIRELLRISEGPENQASAARWEAAQLIWEEIEEGKTYREVAAEISKSHVHVGYMARCWDIVVVKQNLIYGGYSDLPNFNTVYHSEEIRGTGKGGKASGRGREESEEDDDEAAGRNREERDDDAPDYSAHGLIASAAGAIGMLYERRGEWGMISEDDRVILGKMANRILTIGTR